jgi:hypothetical protein
MDLNIRNMDVTLVTRLKSEAALSGQTLRAHCVALLSQELHSGDPDNIVIVDHDYHAHSNERDKAIWNSLKHHATCKCGMCAEMKL